MGLPSLVSGLQAIQLGARVTALPSSAGRGSTLLAREHRKSGAAWASRATMEEQEGSDTTVATTSLASSWPPGPSRARQDRPVTRPWLLDVQAALAMARRHLGHRWRGRRSSRARLLAFTSWGQLAASLAPGVRSRPFSSLRSLLSWPRDQGRDSRPAQDWGEVKVDGVRYKRCFM